MSRSMLLICVIGYILARRSSGSDTLEVQTPLGRVRASYLESRLGRKIFSFRGIRYAEPPISNLRFRPPVPVKPWKGVFDASQEGPACPQPWLDLPISEDCLRLNVYTTEIPYRRGKVKRPVIVFFHHGGFYIGSAQSSLLGPQYLLDHDVVLVTVNYRLSSLGFLSTNDSYLPGNLGLKDQVQALRWVKKNIAAFGGNPSSVTISGYGSGAWSVSLHLVSPMSKGLFHRAIACSGAMTLQEHLPSSQKHLAIKQAKLLNCPTNSTMLMVECLRSRPVEDYVATADEFFEWSGNPVLLWSPIVESKVRGKESFLTSQPIDLIRQGKFHKVPYITGITEDEFGAAVVSFIEESEYQHNSMFNDLNEQWEKLAPIVLLYERNTKRSNEISWKLRDYYLHNKDVGMDNYQGLADVIADGITGFPVHRMVNLLAKYSSQPVYYYKFNYRGRYSHVTWTRTHEPYGVVHNDDLLYLFKNQHFPDFEVGDPEIKTLELLTGIWANFAKVGEPIPKNNELFKNVSWEKYTIKNQKYFDISDVLVMKTGLRTKRMNFLNELFPMKPYR